jgi:hypothetical protein
MKFYRAGIVKFETHENYLDPYVLHDSVNGNREKNRCCISE